VVFNAAKPKGQNGPMNACGSELAAGYRYSWEASARLLSWWSVHGLVPRLAMLAGVTSQYSMPAIFPLFCL